MTAAPHPAAGPAADGPFADVLGANAAYAAEFGDDHLEPRAARGLAIVTCMDSRIDPLGMLGLAKGDAKILRNAGARVTDDVLRTLVLGVYLLGVERVMVVAHTRCRMSGSTDAQIHAGIHAQHGVDTRSLVFATVQDQRATLASDVTRIRAWPFLPAGLPVGGFVYDVATGSLETVVPAERDGCAG